MLSSFSQPVLVSACLVGLCTRYTGTVSANPDCLAYLDNKMYIPCCPEQLGGLPTPRAAADLVGGDGFAALDGTARVITKDGEDVTRPFIVGAEQVLLLAQQQNITEAVLKARSPSCAVHGKIGVTAALLQRHGIRLREF